MKPIIAIPAIIGLVHRAYSRKSLTHLGLATAALTATAHALHPWSAPFALLAVFYFGGTKATKVKHDIKAQLTLSATGSEGGEGQRTHIQVLANSVVATVLILLHTYVLRRSSAECFENGRSAADLLVVGIVANYAAVAADTFSSELGILSKSKPRLITSPTLRVVPPGTNGGVTAAGLLAGVFGAFTVALASAVLLPFCAESSLVDRVYWTFAFTGWGTLGSVLDSVLGGLLQASVVDKRTGKVVEGEGGKKVLVHPHPRAGGATGYSSASASASGSVQQRKGEKGGIETVHESRKIESGRDLLDNNAVNVLMAFIMSVGAMGVAGWVWGVSVFDIAASV